MSATATIKRDDTLKSIALLTMLIDHIGYLLLPQFFFLRLIGRLAFPIFAYYLALGAHRSRQPLRYAFRLFVFGAISQIPYNLFKEFRWNSFTEPNIFFSLLTGLLIIECLRNQNLYAKFMSLPLFFLVYQLGLSYSLYGILLMLSFYYFKDRPVLMSLAVFLSTCQYFVETGNPYQFYALPVLLLIFWDPKFGIRMPKYFAYAFYPVHLLILVGIYHLWF